jgi:hypothetical protein
MYISNGGRNKQGDWVMISVTKLLLINFTNGSSAWTKIINLTFLRDSPMPTAQSMKQLKTTKKK